MELLDELQLVLNLSADFVGYAPGISPGGAAPRQAGQIIDRRLPCGNQFVGVFIPQ